MFDFQTKAPYESQKHNLNLVNHKHITSSESQPNLVRSSKIYEFDFKFDVECVHVDTSSCMFFVQLVHQKTNHLIIFQMSFVFGNGNEIWVQKSK